MQCASRVKGRKKTLCQQRQRQCEGKMIPSTLAIFSIDFAAQDLYTVLACHKSPHQPTSLFRKSLSQLRCYTLSSKLIPFSCLSRYGIRPWGSEDLWKEPWERKSDHMPLSRIRWRKQENQTVFFCSCARKKLNQSRKGYQNTRQSKRRRQNQKRR